MRTSIETWYIADDGARFNVEADCLVHEMLCSAIADALAPLGSKAGLDSGFYIQHTREAASYSRLALLLLIKGRGFCPEHWVTDTIEAAKAGLWHDDDGFRHPSWVARELTGPLTRAWYRICCIDSRWREWDQPYFVAHPNEDAVPMARPTPETP